MPQLQVFNYWHERLAHNNKNDVRNLTKAVVDMKIVDERNEPCDVCNTEKAKWLPISRQVATRAKKTFRHIPCRYIASKQ